MCLLLHRLLSCISWREIRRRDIHVSSDISNPTREQIRVRRVDRLRGPEEEEKEEEGRRRRKRRGGGGKGGEEEEEVKAEEGVDVEEAEEGGCGGGGGGCRGGGEKAEEEEKDAEEEEEPMSYRPRRRRWISMIAYMSVLVMTAPCTFIVNMDTCHRGGSH
jgi:hypothetical protein